MRILFVVGNVYPMDNANSNIVKNLVGEMIKEGHQVTVLGKGELPEQQDGVISDGIEYCYYTLPLLNKINQIYSKLGRFGKVIYLICNPRQFVFKWNMHHKKRFLTYQYKKSCKEKIELICEYSDVDVVIAVSMPIFTNLALAEADISAKKIAYKLDPYAFNELEAEWSFEEKLQIEKVILNNVDREYFPILDYRDMKEVLPTRYHKKMVGLEFPNLFYHEERANKSLYIEEEKEKLTIAYVGFLYEDIRNPRMVLDFLNKLHKDIPIKTYLIGGGCRNIIEEYQRSMQDDLVIISRVSQEEAVFIMRQVDCLLNIGNSVRNMLPSKLFDYFSTGNKVLNFCKLKNCPSLHYMRKFSNGYSVWESNWEEAYEDIKQFLLQKSQKLEFEEVKKIFRENTPEYVSRKIMDDCGELREGQ